VAITLKSFRNGDVGFIDWLDALPLCGLSVRIRVIVYAGADSEDALPIDVEGHGVNAMHNAYRLIRVAIPDITIATQQKCATAMEATFDLARFIQCFLRANVW
jgi:hypothetical protein